jgi:hypothetical protein
MTTAGKQVRRSARVARHLWRARQGGRGAGALEDVKKVLIRPRASVVSSGG